MEIEITPDEFAMCVYVANDRQRNAVKAGKRNTIRKMDWVESVSVHVHGCVGELAAAKALGVQWTGSVDTFKQFGDLRGELEIRHRTKKEWDLIVRPSEANDRLYVLTRGTPPDSVEVVGYIQGHLAKQDKWKKDYGGRGEAYFVPADALRPLEELSAQVR